MPAPVTPLVGCDTFILDASNRVLLIQRADNGFWALPGGFVDVHESPAVCAARECLEETGLEVRITRLLGVFSSCCYPHANYPHYDRAYCHVLFQGKIVGGHARVTEEAKRVEWFDENNLPHMSDGHAPRVVVGFETLRNENRTPYFE